MSYTVAVLYPTLDSLEPIDTNSRATASMRQHLESWLLDKVEVDCYSLSSFPAAFQDDDSAAQAYEYDLVVGLGGGPEWPALEPVATKKGLQLQYQPWEAVTKYDGILRSLKEYEVPFLGICASFQFLTWHWMKMYPHILPQPFLGDVIAELTPQARKQSLKRHFVNCYSTHAFGTLCREPSADSQGSLWYISGPTPRNVHATVWCGDAELVYAISDETGLFHGVQWHPEWTDPVEECKGYLNITESDAFIRNLLNHTL